LRQNIDSHTRQLAEQLLRDTEQTSLLRLNTWLLVARRLAKVTQEHEIYAWLGAELAGYDQPDNDPVQKKYAYLTGRLLDRESGNGDWRPIAEIEADTECDYRRNIGARLQSLVHDFATDIYYRLEFGNQTENTFQFQRSAIDMELATYIGHSLNRIPVLYDRLSKHDTSAVAPVVETCQQMVDTFSVVVTQRGKRRLGANASRELSAELDLEDKCERVEQFISTHCKESSRVDRLIQSFKRLLQYLSTTNIHAITPSEAKYLVLHTYIVLAEIFSLKTQASR
jgi:hypothetical protein